ncbi:hypothetical protein C8R46DRAFT_1228854 [Mycena filopes]|nr:hypothetical protein C8R46DRAFT_1228854 [Mycena filopes]
MSRACTTCVLAGTKCELIRIDLALLTSGFDFGSSQTPRTPPPIDLPPGLVIPASIRSGLLPAADLSVWEFSSFTIPNAAIVSSTQHPHLGDFFPVNFDPTEITADVNQLKSILPPATPLLSSLYQHAKGLGSDVVAFKCLHLVGPRRSTLCPLWIISFWVSLEDLRPTKTAWHRATTALLERTKITPKERSGDLVRRVIDALGVIPWSGHLSLYTTKAWLTDVQISQLLDLLRSDVLRNGSVLDDDVPEIWLMESIKTAYQNRHRYGTASRDFPRAATYGSVGRV